MTRQRSTVSSQAMMVRAGKADNRALLSVSNRLVAPLVE